MALEKHEENYRIAPSLRALMILEVLADAGRPLTPTEINETLQLPKPTIHRLCHTLLEQGFLAGALLVSLLGTMASMNALKYIALALAVVGVVRWRPVHFVWFAAAASWMPALGYILSRLITIEAPTNLRIILAIRLTLAVVAVILVWLSHRQKNLSPNP